MTADDTLMMWVATFAPEWLRGQMVECDYQWNWHDSDSECLYTWEALEARTAVIWSRR